MLRWPENGTLHGMCKRVGAAHRRWVVDNDSQSTQAPNPARKPVRRPEQAAASYGYRLGLAPIVLADPFHMNPDDDNGAILTSMAKSGIDLSKPHTVAFTNLAPNQSSARAFAREAAVLGFAIEVAAPDAQALETGDSDWDITCTRDMIPSYDNITRCTEHLLDLAKQFDCEQDGWGFEQ